MKRIFQRCPLR